MFMLCAAAGCGNEPAVGIPVSDEVAPTVTRELSPPSLQGSPATLTQVNLKGVLSREELASRVLVFGELPPLDQETVTLLMNTIEAPCQPCEGRTLASCMAEMPTGCENMPVLIERSVDMLQNNASPNEVRAALTYSDVWLPLPTDDRRVDGSETGVRIEVWIDPASASIRPVIDTLDGLELSQTGVTFRIIPLDETADSRAWSAAAIAAENQGKLESFLRAVRVYRDEQRAQQGSMQVMLKSADIEMLAISLIDAGLDKERFDADRSSSNIFVRIDSDLVLAKEVEVRVAPSWFVDGYRLRGAQSDLAIQRVIDIQRKDHLSGRSKPTQNPSGLRGD
jgi:hypothetical protein